MNPLLWIGFGLFAVVNIVLIDLVIAVFHRMIGESYYPITIRKFCAPTLGDIILFLFVVGSGGFGALLSTGILGLGSIALMLGAILEGVEWLCNYSAQRGPLWSICKRKDF